MSIIEHPLVTEKAMNQMDFDNKLQFIVHIDSTKSDVKDEVQSRYDVTVEKVNTQVTMKGKKKATVRLSEDDDAQEVASRIGVF
ncbi:MULTISPECIES: 50S ribosomal protein L23 [Haloferax]|uniref:Large ribosomal subunit protein uL23 n=4 Tax=Haloferax TaxID=2251 RepID=A0A0K1IVJ9_HALGI|nr:MULTISPECIES: 50S ribosomal protein L23 [Haloferax]AKU08577.1 50S ribosomal protein L23 [Haloferax gibbonsii]ELZ67017.1 50S ribosomal protein L23P [Haloferax prahovense DSM 18310]ELZ81296.1 50S ribosomal protein L23P [Haloferax gibbonsii ATCC 33959]MDS0240976.1 50S ribosomal protein L23 [Haloferax sp. S2CR25]MDS0444097.1 50S ribosomal protein L23 [Haloferax sp. S2CR25-2]